MNIPRKSSRHSSPTKPWAGVLLGVTVLAAAQLLPGTALANAPKQGTDLAGKKTGHGILFQCSALDAAAVYLAGDLNGWAENKDGVISDSKCRIEGPDSNGIWQRVVCVSDPRYAMNKGADGVWKIEVALVRDVIPISLWSMAASGRTTLPPVTKTAKAIR